MKKNDNLTMKNEQHKHYDALIASLEAPDFNSEHVQELIALGADINMANNLGWTYLQKASSLGKLEAVKRAIAIGANVNLSDFNGWAPLHEACHSGHLEVVKVLIDAGADPNQNMSTEHCDDTHTPLELAMENNHQEIIDLLSK